MMAVLKERNRCDTLEGICIWFCRQASDSLMNGFRAARNINFAVSINTIYIDDKTVALCYFA
jgi:hypothetical protein